MAMKASIDVVIPIFNEEVELAGSIKKLHAYLSKNFAKIPWRITIVDNASTDRSLAIALKLSKELDRIFCLHLPLKGRGRAVKRAWEESPCTILIYMDVDLSTDLGNLPKLVEALSSGFDIAIGSRLLEKSKVSNRPLKREILSRGYNLLIKLFFQTQFSDAQCGFKGITKRVGKVLLPYIEDDAWFFDSELLIVGEKRGFRIYEEPVHWVDNPGSTVRVLHTVTGDLLGLVRLFISRPWNRPSP